MTTVPHKWPLCQPAVVRCITRNTPRFLGWWSADASRRRHQKLPPLILAGINTPSPALLGSTPLVLAREVQALLPPKLLWRRSASPLRALTQIEYGPVGNPPGYRASTYPYVVFHRAHPRPQVSSAILGRSIRCPFYGASYPSYGGSGKVETLHHDEVGRGYRPTFAPIQEDRLDGGTVEHTT